MVQLTKHDLEFILNQIKIAEEHAAGTPLTELVDSPLLPHGLRTVDGSYNNIVPGREQWGASGEPFPRLTTPTYRNEGDDQMMFGTPANPVWLTNNDYASTGGTPPGPGQLAPGTVVDADPRIISNLIVDQTLNNPAAIAAAVRHAGLDGQELMDAVGAITNWHTVVKALPEGSSAYNIAKAQLDSLLDQYGVEMDGPSIRLPNVAPDDGISASYNSWFTLFGQFFDHGLDLVKKGGNGTVYIPLQPDDPLYDPNSPHTNFMAMTRASVGDAAANVTTPWVDQNQTYTSHASHQVFLREYAMVDGKPVATGRLLDGDRGLPTWADVKEQARTMLGIELTDADVGAVPLLRTDPYGKFIPDPVTGFAQVIVGLGPDGIPNTADDIVISGTPDAPVSLANAVRTANAFLDDIAHAAVPVLANGVLQADDDDDVGYSGGFDTRGNQTSYDNELLDAHYITGDGRGNENIGLTAVHHVFHSEHNRLVQHTKETVLATGDLAFLNEWLLTPVLALPTTQEAIDQLIWNGERLFQAARFTTEMQYQHLVFEEFARKVQPDIDIFMVQPDVELNPAIFAEFAHVVYRFGHSMLNETVDRIEADGTDTSLTLFEAFLNPLAFGSETMDHNAAAGAIVRGMTGQVGNEIDEFVTNVLRNQLVGIPLDLAAINIARGRDTGMPSLNEARAQFKALAGGDTQLDPYTSWADFALNLKNPESIINFIAAYGTHASIMAAATVEAKRDAAMALVFGGAGAPADRLDFLNARGIYADRKGGLDDVDLWVGGLAEKKMSFGGMLGSTFAFIFEMQMEHLQHADRFYYLSRTQGLNLLTELENNSLAKMVLRNTDLGETGFALPGDIFSVPDHVLYMDYAKQLLFTGKEDPVHTNPTLAAISSLVERIDGNGDGVAEYIRYNGLDHIVIQGTDGDDHIVAGGGDDTVWGGKGNDRIEAGYGVDKIMGGDGDDIITNSGTDIGEVDMLHGDAGNDVIHGGSGMALLFGGSGQDFLITGPDGSEVRGGLDSDFILGGEGMDMLFGNEGDDWVEGGGLFDYIAGDNGELFFNSTIIGHDVLNGGTGDTDYDADSGDDIMFGGDGIQKFIGMWGHDWALFKGQQTGADADMNFPIFPTLPLEVLRDRFSQVEGLSGWIHDDVLRGDDRIAGEEEEDLIFDPTPEGNFMYNELDEAGIARISGLDQIITPDMLTVGRYWADGSGTEKLIFNAGNILLGGGGSDLFEGRGGDDVIDGDAWLNVRVTGVAKDGTAFSVDSLTDNVTLGGVTKPLSAWMVDGAVNPGTLQIVREILWDDSGVDTAVYWDIIDNYEITYNPESNSLTVTHVTQTPGAIDPITGKNRQPDGTDTLYNIEKLRFGDGAGGFVEYDTSIWMVDPNVPPTGIPVISDLTPTEGQPLSVDVSDVGLGPTEFIASYVWEMAPVGSDTWTIITDGATFAPVDLPGTAFGPQAGMQLRVGVVIIDFLAFPPSLRTVYSQPTGPVGVNWNGVPDAVFDGTAGDDIANGGAGVQVLNGNDGSDILNGGAGADTLDGGNGNDILNGDGGNDVLIGGAGDDTINGGAGANDTAVFSGSVANYIFARTGDSIIVTDTVGTDGTDTLTDVERMQYGGVDYTIVAGSDVGETLDGGAGSQILLGLDGNDTLNGGGGIDILIGGAGDDMINGGNGDDLVIWRVGDGRDLVNGGNGTDTVQIVGNSSAETYRIYSRLEALAIGLAIAVSTEIVITRNGTDNASIIAELSNIEEIVITGMGGGDTFIPIGDFTPTSLSTSTITIEGSEGDDEVDITSLLSAHRIVFRSNGGNDTIIGTLRADDVIEFPPGADMSTYTLTENANGTKTLSNGTHSVTFTGEVPQHLQTPTAPNEGCPQDDTPSPAPGPVGPPDDDDDDDDDDDTASAGPGTTPPPPPAGSVGVQPVIQLGTAGNDAYVGGAGNDTLLGQDGDDTLFGLDGDDNLAGGAGNDTLIGGAGKDVLLGNDGNDTILAGTGDDTIFGGAGDDVINGEDGDDLIWGNEGRDVINGGAGNDIIFASINDGDDVINGGEGTDTLDMSAITANITVDLGTTGIGTAYSTQSGTDTLTGIENFIGGSGNDTIIASNAVNVLNGGAGNDVFVFRSAAAANGDRIEGFEPGDKIDLRPLYASLNLDGNVGDYLTAAPTFTAAGQLRLVIEGEDTLIMGTTDADADAEFVIRIAGRNNLTSNDFA